MSPEPLPFSAETFYIEFPEYLFLGEKDGIYYIAAFPTDVQFDMDNEENTNLYYKIREDIDTILETFIMKYFSTKRFLIVPRHSSKENGVDSFVVTYLYSVLYYEVSKHVQGEFYL